ncbi:MAG: hypothetical protein ACXVCE_16395 [Bacteriovorax sp.]
MSKKIGLLIFSLCVSTVSYAEMTCTTIGGDGALTVKITNPDEYYNGKIELIGQGITNYFSSELQSLKADCQSKYSRPVCVFPARIDLNKKDFFNGGRFAPGFIGFLEATGFKILPTANGQPIGKNWFFNNCESRD